MTARAGRLSRGGGRLRRRLSGFWSAISAVSIKELRGRMRGRRAFVVVTIYLLLLSIFAFAIYTYLKQQAATTSVFNNIGGFPRDDFGFDPTIVTNTSTALGATIGHSIFGGLLFVETLLVLVLAPAFTSGAISLEREKQTLDLLITTPLSTLGMVVGKLLSALTYVFLLILASIPLASLVFVFGGVGPEDLIRGYLLLFALAFGMGAIGLFISALVKRTQTATVITFVVVLALSIGSMAVHEFWMVASRSGPTTNVFGNPISVKPRTAPEALLWLNPFVGNLDLICTTAPSAYHESCTYVSTVTGRPYFGSSGQNVFPQPGRPGGGIDFNGAGRAEPPVVMDGREAPPLQQQLTSFGFPRDTFWPKSAAAFVLVGLLLTVASAQLVSPTRRLGLRRPTLRRPTLRRPSFGRPRALRGGAAPAISEQPTDPATAQPAEPVHEATQSPEPHEPADQSTETVA
jgi:ABC-type transport system involved in multi-copper enzyme maturation permease subunit